MDKTLEGFELVWEKNGRPLYPTRFKLVFCEALQTNVICFAGKPDVYFQNGRSQAKPFKLAEKSPAIYEQLQVAARKNYLYVVCVNLPKDSKTYVNSKWKVTNAHALEELFRQLLELSE